MYLGFIGYLGHIRVYIFFGNLVVCNKHLVESFMRTSVFVILILLEMYLIYGSNDS